MCDYSDRPKVVTTLDTGNEIDLGQIQGKNYRF